MLDRLDPELAPVAATLPVWDLTDVVAARVLRAARYKPIPRTSAELAVGHSDHLIPLRGDEPDVLLRVFRPQGNDEVLPCLFWIQGGGYVLTSPDLDDQWCKEIADRHTCVVASVDWRRAPESPFPAALDDSFAGLSWVVAHRDELKVDGSRIVVGGHSSGGGSAAGLALFVRDHANFSVAHQLLIYPMLDDTSTTPSSHEVTDPELWNREKNKLAWQYYLGSAYGTDEVSPYAAPTRMKDLSGLAPASILTGEFDLFVDEDVAYAQRLSRAGTSTELHVYRGAHHGFDRQVPQAHVSKRFYADRDAILDSAFSK